MAGGPRVVRDFRRIACRGLFVGVTVVATLMTGVGPGQAAPAAAADTVWRVTDLTRKVAGQVFSVAQGTAANPINNAGLVAGSVRQKNGEPAAAVYDTNTKTLTVIPHVPGVFSLAADVNNRGEVAGQTQDAHRFTRAFWWSTRTGEVRLFTNPPHPSLATATALNDRGDVLVNPQLPSEVDNGIPVLWNARTGAVTTLVGLTVGSAVNNHRWVTGEGGVLGRPLVWTPNRGLLLLPLPNGFTSGDSLTLNNKNQIVGAAYNPDTTTTVKLLWRSAFGQPCRVSADIVEIYAMNSRTEMVGIIRGGASDYAARAAYWKGCGHPVTLLPEPRGVPYQMGANGPYGINRSGRVVGWSFQVLSPGAQPSYVAHLWERKPAT